MPTGRPFFAARIEDRLHGFMTTVARRLGCSERVIGYTGYGSSAFVRVMARVVLSPADRLAGHPEGPLQRRGWRNFLTVPAEEAPVEVTIGETTYQGRAGRGGFVDARIEHAGLEPGWHQIEVRAAGSPPVNVQVRVMDPAADVGLVSDIDDTVISTSLPRPLLAAWNTFVLHESARQAVPGMSDFYQSLGEHYPDLPVFYLSTGAWNVAPVIERFLKHHHFPLGPLLMTDWGPTNTGWFRSGRQHKERQLRRLADEFPHLSWLLIGDDGQHDPSIYGEFASDFPSRVRAIGIRQLSPGEQVLAHGTPIRLGYPRGDRSTPEVRAPDGRALQAGLDAYHRRQHEDST